ncbi:unnamed protein product [Camellia sinensis]
MLLLHLVQAILLKNAVSPLTKISAIARAICTADGISLQISPSSAFGMVMAVLRINSSCFEDFRCDASVEGVDSLDLSVLNSILFVTNDRDSIIVTAYFDDDKTLIFFNFLDNTGFKLDCVPAALGIRTIEYKVPHPASTPDILGIKEPEYEYEVIVGIPSEEFRRVLRHLRLYEEYTVDVSVTDGRVVTFSSGSEHLDLTKENGCIFWGTEENDWVHFRIFLHGMNSFIEASENSALVWMFKSPDSPAMLNCPIGPLGNIKYYFSQDDY